MMRIFDRCLRFVGRTLAAAITSVAAVALWVVCGAPFRMVAAVALLVFVGLALAFMVGGNGRRMVLSGLTLAALLLSPVEVSLARKPGLPRLVPLVMGHPGPTLLERARRGEVVLGGCITQGLEPRWVLVW
jgi:hypothetical protein